MSKILERLKAEWSQLVRHAQHANFSESELRRDIELN